MATLDLKEMGKFLWEGREYGEKMNVHWIDILRYSKASRCGVFGSRKNPCSSKPRFVRLYLGCWTTYSCHDDHVHLNPKFQHGSNTEIIKVLAWEICNIKLEFAKKVIIQSQITITFYVWLEFLWIRRYNIFYATIIW